jgi:hypothetical protein
MNILEKMIKEVIGEFYLNETEYNDDDIVDLNKINLQSEYDKYNSLLFDNQAPKIPLVFSNRKGALGHVSYMRNRNTGEIKIQKLAITTFYALTYRTFKNTLVHEMIHAYLLGKGIMDSWGSRYSLDPHGMHFHQFADKFNSMGMGFNITKENTEQLELSQKTKDNAKEYVAVFINVDGRPNVTITSPKIYDNKEEVNGLKRLFQHLIDRGKYREVELTFVLSSNPDLIGVAPTVRKLAGSIRYAPTTQEYQKEVMDNGQVLDTFKLKRGGITEDNVGNEWEEFTIS